jgi:hypothetical protein
MQCTSTPAKLTTEVSGFSVLVSPIKGKVGLVPQPYSSLSALSKPRPQPRPLPVFIKLRARVLIYDLFAF